MKQLLILAFTLLCFTGFSQTNEAKIKDIRKLLVVSGGTSTAKAAVEAMAKTMKESQNQNNLPEGFLDEFLKEIDYNELVELYIPIYDKNYTHQEIIDMITFFETPTGKKLIEKTPSIMIESITVGREWGQKLGIKVYEKMQKKQGNNN